MTVWRYDVGSVPLYLLDADGVSRRPVQRRSRAPDPPGAGARHRRRAGARRARARPARLPRERGPRGLPGDRAGPSARRAGGSSTARRAAAGRQRRPSSRRTRRCPPATRCSPTSSCSATSPGRPIRPGSRADELLGLGRVERSGGFRAHAARAAAVGTRQRRLAPSTVRSPARCGPGLSPTSGAPIEHITNGIHLGTWIAPELDALLRECGRPPGGTAGARRLGGGAGTSTSTRCLRVRATLQATARRADRPRSLAADDRLRATLRHVQARLARLQRPRTAARAAAADRRRRQGASAGRARARSCCRRSSSCPAGRQRGRVVFLEGYDIDLARMLIPGCDVWLNTPRRPYEASGTSGMKAAVNGVLNLSVLDGWWAEAYDPAYGWAIAGTIGRGRRGRAVRPARRHRSSRASRRGTTGPR